MDVSLFASCITMMILLSLSISFSNGTIMNENALNPHKNTSDSAKFICNNALLEDVTINQCHCVDLQSIECSLDVTIVIDVFLAKLRTYGFNETESLTMIILFDFGTAQPPCELTQLATFTNLIELRIFAAFCDMTRPVFFVSNDTFSKCTKLKNIHTQCFYG